jgi:uncharacterized iron-regulated membrane protein
MGAVVDVMLWRKEVSGELLVALVASWGLFYCVSGYMLLSFVSSAHDATHHKCYKND